MWFQPLRSSLSTREGLKLASSVCLCVLDRIFRSFIYIALNTSLEDKFCFLHPVNEEIGTQRGKVTSSRSHSWWIRQLGLEPRCFDFQM